MTKKRSRAAARKTTGKKSALKRPASKWLDAQRFKLEEQGKKLRSMIDQEASNLKITGSAHLQEYGELSEEGREDREVSETLEILQSRLQAVEEALERIQRRTYGTCIDCRRPIPQKRLKTVPSAARCVSCQQAFESKRG